MSKNGKEGISIVSLAVTVVLLIIIASIAIFNGLSENRKKAAETKTTYEIYAILDAVTNRSLLHRLNPNYYTYVGNNNFGTIQIGTEGNKQSYSGNGDWYLLSSRAEFAELGLDNTIGQYLINYVTGEVIATNGVAYEGKTYYSINEVKKEMGGGSISLTPTEYDAEKKVNKPVLSSGMVPVKLIGGKWVVCDKEDAGWYDYSKEQSAWANIMLKDDLELEGMTNLEVRNATLMDLIGKEVTTEGSSYVWVPRYTTTSLTGSNAKIIFSRLIEDTFSYNGESYELPGAFTYTGRDGTVALTGFWMSKYEASLDQ